MKNPTLQSLSTDSDFSDLINSRFKQPIDGYRFPPEYEKRRTPQSFFEESGKAEAENITERELMRDNIYVKHGFDIFDFPFVVLYENQSGEERLEPFRLEGEAEDFCRESSHQGTPSLLIHIMNHEIESRLFKGR
ncbi:hypothetical protein EFA69_12775 [Rufibacter immobilis]|uniref:Uncharacterized protein n=1 Tax=Rufibacter immobilis TaxID=1348778 RepID=A0A3M9MTQ9_9BACT|nr:hypothetical protein [Rufibacter immobilis]RNI28914.1 hypothetical protein EFA69_12775 [Rufibacter immobilis]